MVNSPVTPGDHYISGHMGHLLAKNGSCCEQWGTMPHAGALLRQVRQEWGGGYLLSSASWYLGVYSIYNTGRTLCQVLLVTTTTSDSKSTWAILQLHSTSTPCLVLHGLPRALQASAVLTEELNLPNQWGLHCPPCIPCGILTFQDGIFLKSMTKNVMRAW